MNNSKNNLWYEEGRKFLISTNRRRFNYGMCAMVVLKYATLWNGTINLLNYNGKRSKVVTAIKTSVRRCIMKFPKLRNLRGLTTIATGRAYIVSITISAFSMLKSSLRLQQSGIGLHRLWDKESLRSTTCSIYSEKLIRERWEFRGGLKRYVTLPFERHCWRANHFSDSVSSSVRDLSTK